MPNNPPFYTTTISGVTGVSTGITTDFGSTILHWTASIPTATFSGAGDYWISVQGRGADVSDINTYWIWAFADPISGESDAAFQNEGTLEWEAFSASDAQHLTDAFAFTLDTAVIPVPAAFPLLGSALVGLGFMGWRRRKAA